MAVPIQALLKVLREHVPALATFGNFLSGRDIEPALPEQPTEATNPAQ